MISTVQRYVEYLRLINLIEHHKDRLCLLSVIIGNCPAAEQSGLCIMGNTSLHGKLEKIERRIAGEARLKRNISLETSYSLLV